MVSRKRHYVNREPFRGRQPSDVLDGVRRIVDGSTGVECKCGDGGGCEYDDGGLSGVGGHS